MQVIRCQNYIHKLSALFFASMEGCMKYKMMAGQDFFLVKGWSIEDCATKVAEWIAMD